MIFMIETLKLNWHEEIIIIIWPETNYHLTQEYN